MGRSKQSGFVASGRNADYILVRLLADEENDDDESTEKANKRPRKTYMPYQG